MRDKLKISLALSCTYVLRRYELPVYEPTVIEKPFYQKLNEERNKRRFVKGK